MKYRVFVVLTVIALILAMAGTSPAQAAAYGTSFVTSITYQNVGTGPASVSIDFYTQGSATAIPISLPDLPANAGASLFVGSLNQLSAGFQGSAVLNSSQPLVATLVQAASGNPAVKVRPLSNGFSSGAASVLVPTVLKNKFGYTSVVSIQNVDSVGADLTVEFIPSAGTGTAFSVPVVNLPSGSAKYFDMGKFTNAALGASFTGSMRVTAKQTGTNTPGSVVATSIESGVVTNLAYAFEGATQTGSKIYMPSAFCHYLAADYTSTYAVQNTGTSPIDITVTFSNNKTETYSNVAGGAKVSMPGCGSTGTLNPVNFIGSATIETTTGQIAGIAKISHSAGLLTAFLGFVDGSNKIATPFVRWTESQWLSGTRSRAVLAIQNIGTSDLLAGQAKVQYFDKTGQLVTSVDLPAIPVGGKANSNPKDAGAGDEFGYYADGSFGGSALVTGPVGSKLAVIVRISTSTGGSSIVGEDYSGIPVQ